MLRHRRRISAHQPRPGTHGESVPRRVHYREHRNVRESAASGEDILSLSDSDLALASIEEVGKLFRKRKLSPVELTKLMLGRIERLNPKLNAFITVTAGRFMGFRFR